MVILFEVQPRIRKPKPPKPVPEPTETQIIRRVAREMGYFPYAGIVQPAPAPIVPTEPTRKHRPAKPPTAGIQYMPPAVTTVPHVKLPPRIGMVTKPYLGRRPAREFLLEKLEERRKKRLKAKKEMKPIPPEAKPLFPPTLKFAGVEVKTMHVAIGTVVIAIIALLVLT